MGKGNKIETLTKIIGSTLIAGVLVFAGYSVGEYHAANRLRPKIEFKEKQNLELEKRLESEKKQKIEFKVKFELEKLKRLEFEENWKKVSLFNYDGLGKVDFSRKKVTLDVYIDESEEMKVYKKNKKKMFKYVSDFYKEMDVDLDIRFVDAIDQSALKPAKHLAIEIYDEEKCTQRSCVLKGIRSKTDCETGNIYPRFNSPMFNAGKAYVKKNTALACYCTAERLMDVTEEFSLDKLEKMADTVTKAINEGEKECRREIMKTGEKWNEKVEKIEKLIAEQRIINELIRRRDKKTRKRPSDLSIRRKAETIAHEIGHLFGLYHSDQFTNDPVPDYLSTENKVPNYMIQGDANLNYSAEFPMGCGFNEFQKRIVHSYLSRGKVYQQLEAVDFNFYEYYKNIKKANDYKE